MASNKLFAVAFFAAITFIGSVGSAQAQLYKWTDENGKVHYSDTVPPAANDRARKEIREDGVVKKQIDRALTQDERRVAAQKAADEEKARAAKEERERKDKALLATYTSLVDFDRVRDRAVSQADAEIVALQKQEASEAAQRADLQKQLDALGKRAPSLKLKTDVESADKDLAAVRELIVRKTKERATLVATYQTERGRLADLIAAEAAAAKTSGSAPSTPATTSTPQKKKS
jgi:chromosome segregation ATPase